MNVLDIMFLIPLLYGLIRGFIKGFVYQLISTISFALGVFLAIKFNNLVSAHLISQNMVSENWAYVCSFIIIFSAIVLFLFIARKIIEKLLKLAQLNSLNKIAGALLGLLKFTLITLILLHYLSRFERLIKWQSNNVKASILYPHMKNIADQIFTKNHNF